MKAIGFLEIRYYRTEGGSIYIDIKLKGEDISYRWVDLKLNQWHHLKIERRSTGHPDNKCSTTLHVNFNQIFEKITDCGSYSATETELYASCADSSCRYHSVSGLVDSMRFVWL